MERIVIAVDSFKGTMPSLEVCRIIAENFQAVLPALEYVQVPIGDGGEGTVDAFLAALGGEKIYVLVQDPFGREIEAAYGLLPDKSTAVIEMAAASGLPLLEGEGDPLCASTYGTGQLIANALDRGCDKLIIGLGGSATVDGGIGMLAALGVKFLDDQTNPIPLTGQGLADLHRIDVRGKDKRLDTCQILVASDVTNPLFGPNGAAHVFGPQKGATPEMVTLLDDNLRNYAVVLRAELGADVAYLPGAGAAGGLGAAFLAFTSARLSPGIDVLLDTIKFDELISSAALVITGEGRLDGQSFYGKAPWGVAQRAKKQGVPCIAIVGEVGEGAEKGYSEGIDAVFTINRAALPFSEAKQYSQANLAATSADLARFLKIAWGI